jgi:hypothetical protein
MCCPLRVICTLIFVPAANGAVVSMKQPYALSLTLGYHFAESTRPLWFSCARPPIKRADLIA